MIADKITESNEPLLQSINDIHNSLRTARVKVSVIEYIRWVQTAVELFNCGNFHPSIASGIAALRTIVDSLPDFDRRSITQKVLKPYIPNSLYCIVVTDSKDVLPLECPISIVEGSLLKPVLSGRILQSSTSDVFLSALPNASIEPLEHILWTRSSVDMADAVLTAVCSHAITIFEGSPGRGKTAVAYAVLQALGMHCTRINLSPTTTAEDLFGREIPQSVPEGGFTTRFVDGPLTIAMRCSVNDPHSQSLPSQAILLDEINLASPCTLR